MCPFTATERRAALSKRNAPVPSLSSFLLGLFSLKSDFVQDFGVEFIVLPSCFCCYFRVWIYFFFLVPTDTSFFQVSYAPPCSAPMLWCENTILTLLPPAGTLAMNQRPGTEPLGWVSHTRPDQHTAVQEARSRQPCVCWRFLDIFWGSRAQLNGRTWGQDPGCWQKTLVNLDRVA